MPEIAATPPRRQWIEPVIALVMALTTLCTAWCSYQSAAWTRQVNRLMNESNALERKAGLLDVQGSQALISGDVQVAFTSYTAVAAFVKAGRVRILASADGRRTPALPDVPTIAELGLPGFDMASMLGALVPAGTPREIINRLNSGIIAAINSPEVNAKIAGFGVGITTSTPEQFDALMRAEHEKYARLVKLSGAKLD